MMVHRGAATGEGAGDRGRDGEEGGWRRGWCGDFPHHRRPIMEMEQRELSLSHECS